MNQLGDSGLRGRNFPRKIPRETSPRRIGARLISGLRCQVPLSILFTAIHECTPQRRQNEEQGYSLTRVLCSIYPSRPPPQLYKSVWPSRDKPVPSSFACRSRLAYFPIGYFDSRREKDKSAMTYFLGSLALVAVVATVTYTETGAVPLMNPCEYNIGTSHPINSVVQLFMRGEK